MPTHRIYIQRHQAHFVKLQLMVGYDKID